jgi:peptide/nickel transport system permease protein
MEEIKQDKNLIVSSDEAKEEVAEKTSNGGNFNDNLHGENLTERAKVLSPGMTVLKRFFRSKLSVIGLVILIALFLFSFVGPLFSPWKSETGLGTIKDYENITSFFTPNPITYIVDGVEYTAYEITIDQAAKYNSLGGISWAHWMGTDYEGNDVFTNLMYGGRVSLTIGFVVVILETLLGILLGGIAGYFGKWVDQLIMRIVDIISCIPSLPIMLILSAIFDGLQIVTISKLYYMMLVLTLI